MSVGSGALVALALSPATGCGNGSAAGGTGATDGGGAGGASSSTGAGGNATATSTVIPTISGLTITPNPTNNLSCFVRWTTDVASTSEVQFGATAYQFHIVDPSPVTSHNVLVIGMYASTTYRINAVSSDAGGSSSATGTFTTGALPTGLPLGTSPSTTPAHAQSGWTLVNIMPASMGASGASGFNGNAPGIMVMYDQTGVPVWYFVNGTTPDMRGDVSLRVKSNNDIVLGPSSGEPPKEIDLAGNVVWAGPAEPPTGADQTNPATAPMSHYADRLPNGDYVFFRDLTNANGIGGAFVEEVTPDERHRLAVEPVRSPHAAGRRGDRLVPPQLGVVRRRKRRLLSQLPVPGAHQGQPLGERRHHLDPGRPGRRRLHLQPGRRGLQRLPRSRAPRRRDDPGWTTTGEARRNRRPASPRACWS